MSQTTMIGAFLLGLGLVLLGPGAQAQDRIRLAGCSSYYITTFDFNAKKISEMIGSTGYQTSMFMGTGTEEGHTCQKLQLFEGATFSYSFMDSDGTKQQVSGRYRAMPTSFRSPGYLELNGLPVGVLGASILGTAQLYSLVSREDAHVYISCTTFGVFHSENVYTFVPNTPASLRGSEGVRETLALMGVPYSKTLTRSNQSCVKKEEPASDISTDAVPSDTATRDGASLDATSNSTSASETSSSDASTSEASSSDASASEASSSGALAKEAASSDASASKASSSDGSASEASSSDASDPEASSSSPSASDDSSSTVLPSGASSNDALVSEASSIDALASDTLTSDAASPLREVESNAVGDVPQGASSDDAEEPVTESSVDQGQAP